MVRALVVKDAAKRHAVMVYDGRDYLDSEALHHFLCEIAPQGTYTVRFRVATLKERRMITAMNPVWFML